MEKERDYKRVSFNRHLARLLTQPNLKAFFVKSKDDLTGEEFKLYVNNEDVIWVVSAINEDYEELDKGDYIYENGNFACRSEEFKDVFELQRIEIENRTR